MRIDVPADFHALWLQAAFVRVHQDFTRNVLRGGKPNVVKDVRAMLGRDISLEEFKYWTALVRMPALSHNISVC